MSETNKLKEEILACLPWKYQVIKFKGKVKVSSSRVVVMMMVCVCVCVGFVGLKFLTTKFNNSFMWNNFLSIFHNREVNIKAKAIERENISLSIIQLHIPLSTVISAAAVGR